MTVLRARRLALALAAAVALAVPARAGAHPLHTSLANVTYDAGSRRIRIVVRAFIDDFSRVVARYTAAPSVRDVTYGAGFRYLVSAFQIAGPDGNPIPLSQCGTRRTGDLIWLCLEGDVPFSPSAITARDRILCDMFDDQVNIVQMALPGSKRTTLFTSGEQFKGIAP